MSQVLCQGMLILGNYPPGMVHAPTPAIVFTSESLPAGHHILIVQSLCFAAVGPWRAVLI